MGPCIKQQFSQSWMLTHSHRCCELQVHCHISSHTTGLDHTAQISRALTEYHSCTLQSINKSNFKFIYIHKLWFEVLNYPAVIRWEMGTLNPTHPRNLSLNDASVALIHSSYCFSPDPSITWNGLGQFTHIKKSDKIYNCKGYICLPHWQVDVEAHEAQIHIIKTLPHL